MKLTAFLTAGALALGTVAAQAGGFTDTIVEPVVIIEPQEQAGSLPGWVIPVAIAIALIALAKSGDSTDDETEYAH